MSSQFCITFTESETRKINIKNLNEPLLRPLRLNEAAMFLLYPFSKMSNLHFCRSLSAQNVELTLPPFINKPKFQATAGRYEKHAKMH